MKEDFKTDLLREGFKQIPNLERVLERLKEGKVLLDGKIISECGEYG